MESRFERLEGMKRKLVEMQSKISPMVPIANHKQDLIEIPLAESKGKEIGREEFDEESFFHQELPPRTLIRGKSMFLDGVQQGENFMVEVVS
ncbi:hypothetical protein IEQ34_007053 [Dendrobium chrysotoxum]|uniref:Uncharacterized protein n=1 Tax=Dendrobium chrysotoxum TaxID=161865 RepID=A0AAV7H8T1_DENCH|nr:hypothetical protein IEQ34_007053 [Dendrobium chrysotoxum]